MDRARRLRAVWDWLPAFRAVAESEHLPTAARALHISPSALSRAVHLLEDGLGCSLFERGQRQLRLNPAGRALLASVRSAMRQLDDALAEINGTTLAGQATIAASADLVAWLVAPALQRVLAAAPGLLTSVVGVPRELGLALRRGDLDVVVTDVAVAGEGVQVERLGEVRWGIYAAGRRSWLDSLAFVVAAGEPWPRERVRHVAAVVADSAEAADACLGPLVAWLPAPLARDRRLTEVRGGLRAVVPIYLVTRVAVGAHPRTDVVTTALRDAAQARLRRRPATGK